MAGHPLRPATRHRLGRPSPHQQADRPRAHPPSHKAFPTHPCEHARISGIRPRFQGLSQKGGQVTHVLLTRSPLIHPQQVTGFIVRLACVKHAASVRPEPGSNSPSKNRKKKTQQTKTGQNQSKNHTTQPHPQPKKVTNTTRPCRKEHEPKARY